MVLGCSPEGQGHIRSKVGTLQIQNNFIWLGVGGGGFQMKGQGQRGGSNEIQGQRWARIHSKSKNDCCFKQRDFGKVPLHDTTNQTS